MPRVWFYRPEWYWFGWRTLIPFWLGGDEFNRRTVVFGWSITGQIVIALWSFPLADDGGDHPQS